jgi:uncharacterized small protein (DUF1192 family)
MMNIDTEGLVKLNALDTVEDHCAVIGMTGSGKTHFLKIFAKELSPAIKLTIVDPEGAFGDLRFSRKTIIVGKGRPSAHIDIALSPDNAGSAADVLCHYDIPIVVLNIQGFEIDEQDEFVFNYVTQLWRNYRFEENLPPHRLIIDEVQLFAPQSKDEKKLSKNLLRDMAARSRKFNIPLTVATQEPQSVFKPILNQTSYRVFLQMAKGTAMDAVARHLPASVINAPGKVDVKDMIASMNRGDALFMIRNNAKRVHIRPDDGPHPINEKGEVAVQLPFDDGVLDRLRGLISSNQVADSIKADVKREIDDDKCLQELQDRIAFLESENKRLQAELTAALQNKAIDEFGKIESFGVPMVPEQIIERDQKRQTEAEQRDLTRQRRGYQNLLLNIKRQSELDRRILSFMLDHDGTEYDAEQIKIAAGLSVTTHISMTALVSAELVCRRKIGRVYFYSTPVLARVDEHYPLIGRSTAIEEIARLAAK